MAIYKVQGPDGQHHELEGPDGATDSEIIAQAQSLIPKKNLPDPTANREAIEPGVMGETEPVEQKFLNNINAAGAGVTLPNSIASLAKPLGKGAGWAAEQLERIGRNQTMKGFGGSMSQIRQMAESGGIDKAARFANESGFNDVFSTSLGREKDLNNLSNATGAKLGQLREEAGTVLNPEGLEETVMTDPKMAKYLGQGLESGQAKDIPKALDDVQRISGSNPSYADRAQAATFLNKSAAGSKLYQPTSATTDIANIVSQDNNAGIHASLGPEKGAEYTKSLDEYSNLQPLKHLQDRGELREMAGRGGAGGLLHGVKQGVADAFGYRAVGKGAYAASDAASVVSEATKTARASLGGVTSQLMDILSTNPQHLGKYAAPLMKAAQTGGKDGLAATHYLLSTTHPEYSQLLNGKGEDVNADR